MSRSGMMYTTFALAASSVILVLAFTGVADTGNTDAREARISEVSFFHESIMDDMGRTVDLSARRALTSVTNYVIIEGEPLDKPEAKITSALVNGTVDEDGNVSMENASLEAWEEDIKDVASRSGYRISVEFLNSSFSNNGLTVDSGHRVFSRLKDPVTLTAFNETRYVNVSTSLTGIEDVMITLESNGAYVSSYRECSFEDPAEQVYTGADHSTGSVHGYAAVEPSGSAADREERILVVEDIDGFTGDQGSYAGVVSIQSNSSSIGNDNYVADTTPGSIDAVQENSSLVLSNGTVWRTGFREMMETESSAGCYITDPGAPGFLDRLQGDLVSNSTGIMTLVNLDMLQEAESGRSAVAHVYFNESENPVTHEVAGVTSDYSWFELDDEHVQRWGMEDLTR